VSKFNLKVFVRGLTQENQRSLGNATFILLDGTLGEFVVETRIAGIDLHPLPDDPEGKGLRPFADLSSIVALPVLFPVSLHDTLDAAEDAPDRPADDKAREPDSDRWSLFQMQSGAGVSLVGVRDGLLDHPSRATLDHEVLLVVHFNATLETGLPSSVEELESARSVETWVKNCLRGQCAIEKAVHVMGDRALQAWFYTADPSAAIAAWEKDLQPKISSHQVAFYIRRDPQWEVYNHFAQIVQGASQPETASVARQFLVESLARCRELLERTPALRMPAQVFAYGAVKALGEEEKLDGRQIIGLTYTLFLRVFQLSQDESATAARWVQEHEKEPAVQAVINEGAEAVRAWRSDVKGVSRLGELLAAMNRAGG
jgi:hypothetical protein